MIWYYEFIVFNLFFFSFNDIRVGWGVLLSWPEFFMFPDPRLILSSNNTGTWVATRATYPRSRNFDPRGYMNFADQYTGTGYEEKLGAQPQSPGSKSVSTIPVQQVGRVTSALTVEDKSAWVFQHCNERKKKDPHIRNKVHRGPITAPMPPWAPYIVSLHAQVNSLLELAIFSGKNGSRGKIVGPGVQHFNLSW